MLLFVIIFLGGIIAIFLALTGLCWVAGLIRTLPGVLTAAFVAPFAGVASLYGAAMVADLLLLKIADNWTVAGFLVLFFGAGQAGGLLAGRMLERWTPAPIRAGAERAGYDIGIADL